MDKTQSKKVNKRTSMTCAYTWVGLSPNAPVAPALTPPLKRYFQGVEILKKNKELNPTISIKEGTVANMQRNAKLLESLLHFSFRQWSYNFIGLLLLGKIFLKWMHTSLKYFAHCTHICVNFTFNRPIFQKKAICLRKLRNTRGSFLDKIKEQKICTSSLNWAEEMAVSCTNSR